MRVIDAVPGSKIYVGQQLEDKATMVRFDASPFYSLYGDEGTFSLRVQRYGEAEGYPIGYPSVFVEDGYVCWILGESDAAIAGENEVQLRYITDDAVSMSMKFVYVVKDSIVTGETIPAPMKEWAEAIIDAAAEIVPMPEDMVRVPTTDTLDTVMGIEDGEVKQASLDDLKTAMGVPTAADEISFDPDATGYLEADNVQDAIDECYELTRRRGGHSSESVACTTGMTLLRTITNLPSGYKIVNAELWYNASSPVELCMSTNQQYSNIAHASNTGVTKTLQVLTCTGITSATTIYIYGKSGAAGNNNVAFNWCLAFEE